MRGSEARRVASDNDFNLEPTDFEMWVRHPGGESGDGNPGAIILGVSGIGQKKRG